jgi:ankyrin repeat protein
MMNQLSWPLCSLTAAWLLGTLLLIAEEKTDPPKFSRNQQLIVAAFNLEVDQAAKLLEDGADVNARMGEHPQELFQDKWSGGWPISSPNWTPLLAVANSEREPQPDKLVENTSEAIEAAAEARRRVDPKLIAERDRRRVAIARLLIGAKADLNLHDGYGETALASSVYNGYDDIALLLLDAGANVNTQTRIYIDGTDNITPLHRAADRPRLVKAMLEHGADPNPRDSTGRTPLHWAVQSAVVESVRLLIAAGADVNVKDKDGETPLASIRIIDLPPLRPGASREVAELFQRHARDKNRLEQIAHLLRKAGER